MKVRHVYRYTTGFILTKEEVISIIIGVTFSYTFFIIKSIDY